MSIPAGFLGTDRTAWTLRTLRFVYDGHDVAAYYQDGGLLTRLVHGPTTDELLARQTLGGTAASSGTRWYVTDRQNSVQGLVTPQDLPGSEPMVPRPDAPTGDVPTAVPAGSWVKVLTYGAGGVDRAWGRDFNLNTAAASVDALRDEFEYTGRLFDQATGLQFNRARWLNPGTGQFMGKDSYGYAAGDANPYRYAGGDPANATDPSGHFGILGAAMVGMAVGAAVGGLATGRWDGMAGYAFGGLAIGLGVGLALAGWRPELSGALIGFGVGFIYGGTRTNDGSFSLDKAIAGGLSGAMVGVGFGMALRPGVAGSGGARDALSQGLIGAGVGGLMSLDSAKDMSWRTWAGDSVVGFFGGAGGALGGRGGHLAGMSAGGAAGNALGQGVAVGLGLRDEFDAGEVAVSGLLPLGLGALGRTAAAKAVAAWGGKAAAAVASGLGSAAKWSHGGVEWALAKAIHGGLKGAEGTATRRAHDVAQSWARRAGFKNVCFAAGTPVEGEGGSKPVEAFARGDLVWSRDEHDPSGPAELKTVEEVFVRFGQVLWLCVGGRKIGTTAEHPFSRRGDGWVPAGELRVGDELLCRDGSLVAVEAVEAGAWQAVYNLRVADTHTYFVGCEQWGFSVWAHNASELYRTAGSQADDGLKELAERIVKQKATSLDGVATHGSPAIARAVVQGETAIGFNLPAKMGADKLRDIVRGAGGVNEGLSVIRQAYKEAGLEMHPIIENRVRTYLTHTRNGTEGYTLGSRYTGLPGLHAEVVAANEALWKAGFKGTDEEARAFVGVAVRQLFPSQQATNKGVEWAAGAAFVRCDRCSRVLAGFHTITDDGLAKNTALLTRLMGEMTGN